ncbi:hypothetical protein CH063_03698 [Colletotrichum higginsianum]|uniref:Uncharacterized protein n=1 Tax=Colletotrichum higginsianum (strain IMI 349063) TaxID=759273 RepID=H1VZY0_COLHI|nr:hypothetical protein CH063_03698 [Colletotrichum higginsianum]
MFGIISRRADSQCLRTRRFESCGRRLNLLPFDQDSFYSLFFSGRRRLFASSHSFFGGGWDAPG